MRINSIFLIFVLLTLLSNISAQKASDTFFKNADNFFNRNVVNVRVDYASIKDNSCSTSSTIPCIINKSTIHTYIPFTLIPRLAATRPKLLRKLNLALT